MSAVFSACSAARNVQSGKKNHLFQSLIFFQLQNVIPSLANKNRYLKKQKSWILRTNIVIAHNRVFVVELKYHSVWLEIEPC